MDKYTAGCVLSNVRMTNPTPEYKQTRRPVVDGQSLLVLRSFIYSRL